MATISRYTHRCLSWPQGSADRQLEYLLHLGMRYRLDGWALFPTTDEAAALLARHHAVLGEWFKITTPPWEVMRWAYDKRLTYGLAGQLGVDYPWTHYPRSREELAAVDCAFPVILKPAIKRGVNRLTDAKAWRVDNRQELLARYDEACTLVDPDVIMVQELIPGGGDHQFSFAALCADGRPLASMVARRVRQHPMDFGRFSTYVETIDEPVVEEVARRLLATMCFTGLVEVEFKRDPRTGRPKLLDINARTWAWHTLGRRAGIDFPYLLWRLLQGQQVPETHAPPGVRWVRMVTDFPAACSAIRCGSLSWSAYFRSLRGPLEFATLAKDDPLPAILELPVLMYRSWERRALLRTASREDTTGEGGTMGQAMTPNIQP